MERAAGTVTDNEIATLARLARHADYDRYLCALFAPARRRGALFTLIAFNHEVARIRDVVSEPMLGLIRLQWWREVIETAYTDAPARRHEVAAPLTDVIRAQGLSRAHFDRLLDAREHDMEDAPHETLAALTDYARATAGGMTRLMLEALGADDDASAKAGAAVGVAWALVGLLRALPFHASGGRVMLPTALFREAGLAPEDLPQGLPHPGVAPVVETVAAAARESLASARRERVPRGALAPLLQARLATLYLAKLRRLNHDPFAAPVSLSMTRRQLALMGAMLTGRI